MDLGDRMKEYENVYDGTLMNRVPVIVRVDGKGFSKWTKSIHATKPFDDNLSLAMANTMQMTASNIEGCMFAFTQSDEMTFVLRNDQSNESTPWFGNRVQKICSIVASMVTAHFSGQMSGLPVAYFDTRVFSVPNIQEAINCLIWRQNDAVKNSISCACYYEVAKKLGKKTSRKMMHGLNQNQQQEMLFKDGGINWNDYPTKYKRGIGTYKVGTTFNVNGNEFFRAKWTIDNELPIFSKDKNFLNKILSGENNG